MAITHYHPTECPKASLTSAALAVAKRCVHVARIIDGPASEDFDGVRLTAQYVGAGWFAIIIDEVAQVGGAQ